ncbi:MAG: chemotaxis protein CheX [Candidatus Schekmanbacteria bacterium]|nr:chemotaxis protein CheX [Candidatus Schekmanbacteria bacterium]
MKAEHINAFIQPSINVLREFVGIGAQIGDLYAKDRMYSSHEVSVIIGVSGHISGAVIMSLNTDTALRLAGKMLGQDVPAFDEYAEAAICELGNIIVGQALANLDRQGLDVNITPPTMVVERKSSVRFAVSRVLKTLVVPLETTLGQIELNISLLEKIR